MRKKFEVKYGERFTVYETNRLYDCECFKNGCSDDSGLTIQDNRPEMLMELNAMSKEIAEQIERKGGVNPSYEALVSKIMNDPDNVWVDETDSVDLMGAFVSLQLHVLDCMRPKRKLRRIIRAIKNK